MHVSMRKLVIQAKLPNVTLLLLLSVTAFVVNAAVAAKDLPKSFSKCKRDANFDKCLVDAVNEAIQILKPGNDDFHIPILDPLHVKSLVVEAGTPPINLKQALKNLQVHHIISSTKIQRYRTKLEKYLIVCDSLTKRIEMLGDYEMSGRILLLPITGSGKSNLTLVDAQIEHRLIGEPYEKDGRRYMRLKDYQITMNPKRVYMHFDNLFNDALLSQTMNRFLNDNWETVFNELKGGYSKSFGSIFRDISNLIFEKVPMDEIFLS
uniref:Protein takeout n=1 Tax=Glossina pallidipes TaxID=7398 RepID=A0A1A9ZY56_GLOPL